MTHDGVPAPVAKLDAQQLLREVNQATGAGLEFLGYAGLGEVGAAFVRWPDGRDGVLTRGYGSLAELRRTAEVLEAARRGGLPVPQYQLLADLPDGIGVVQERLPGRPPETVDRAFLESMIALTDHFAGLAPDLPVPSMYLLESGPGFCLHESLQRYDDRTRRLLDWIHEVGRDEPSGMTGDDLVHLDFHAGNVLTDAGRITGIVDWDGIGRGDRRFALVTLRFDAHVRLDGADLTWFDELLENTLNPAVLRLYWAHMSLRQVDWSIRHHTPADTTHWLDFSETRMR
ncbi:phosphotransferase family enzyme [Kribbella sp. VKM Ac-2569]|uniref:phosphotransferase n=1 Tax=Kribbella sp. VKM Ac-2569 TaxID=2512220 RepID=UPI0010D2F9E1|nr:phosphotransferase [Kribbella sp. VKM Ac-2569]RZT19504.1 phosphotransferase family enzyme [Kribbella sp. VKM Ac-2569]